MSQELTPNLPSPAQGQPSCARCNDSGFITARSPTTGQTSKLYCNHDGTFNTAPGVTAALSPAPESAAMAEPRWTFTCLRPDHTDVYDKHVLKEDYDALAARFRELQAAVEHLSPACAALLRRAESAESRAARFREQQGQATHWRERYKELELISETVNIRWKESESRAEQLQKEVERRDIALCSLTPGGSEYANDPDACVAYVRRTRLDQHETIMAAIKARREAESLASQAEAALQGMREIREAARNVCIAHAGELATLPAYIADLDELIQLDAAKAEG